MFARIIPGLMNAAERGWLPDALLRVGIRRLVAQRLIEESQGNCEDWQGRLQQFVDEASAGPIAPVPDKANEQHYEVPAEFFERVLGRRLKYSCCYWPDGVETLDEAEVAALEATCRRADIRDGMHVLDLGCGWGSASLWIAKNFPTCQITSVSNSASQRAFIEQRATQAGYHNLRVITADMNDFQAEATFDRVISVEMFEHMRNHSELLRRISTWLNPGGKLFVHVFCHRLFTYPFQANGDADWMAEHFFTGGIMPGDDLLVRYQDDLKLTRQWRWSGQHYQRTSEAWLRNLDAHSSDLRKLFQETYGRSDGDRWITAGDCSFSLAPNCSATGRVRNGGFHHYRFERP